jgi:hypothetical protein
MNESAAPQGRSVGLSLARAAEMDFEVIFKSSQRANQTRPSIGEQTGCDFSKLLTMSHTLDDEQ